MYNPLILKAQSGQKGHWTYFKTLTMTIIALLLMLQFISFAHNQISIAIKHLDHKQQRRILSTSDTTTDISPNVPSVGSDTPMEEIAPAIISYPRCETLNVYNLSHVSVESRRCRLQMGDSPLVFILELDTKIIGAGAYGLVCKAQQLDQSLAPINGAIFAIKYMAANHNHNWDKGRQTELVYTRAIWHIQQEKRLRNVVPLLYVSEYVAQDPFSVIVMPYYSNGDLYRCVHDKRWIKDIIPLHFTWNYIINLAELMRELEPSLHRFIALNKPFVYSDFKPENILLDSDGNMLLTDFGLMQPRIAELPPPHIRHSMQMSYDVCGTPVSIPYHMQNEHLFNCYPEMVDISAMLNSAIDLYGMLCKRKQMNDIDCQIALSFHRSAGKEGTKHGRHRLGLHKAQWCSTNLMEYVHPSSPTYDFWRLVNIILCPHSTNVKGITWQWLVGAFHNALASHDHKISLSQQNN